MKKFNLLFIKVAFISLLINSCSRSEDINNIGNINENQISKMLVFKKSTKNVSNPFNKKSLVIVSWSSWGRASRNCDGWGLCNANWFYCVDETHEEVPCSGKNGDGYSAPLQYDSNEDVYFIEILFDETPTIDPELLTLKVESQIVLSTSSDEEIARNLVIPVGNYLYDENIGTNGGIRIYLQ